MSGVSDRLKNITNSISSPLNEKTFQNSSESKDGIMTDYKFFGWVGKDKNSIGNLVWEEYEPKTWTEDDVDIKISIAPSPVPRNMG
jgi:hypothetical protein